MDATLLFFEAIEAGDLERVRELLVQKPDLLSSRNSDGLSPVLFAAYHHNGDMLDELLEREPTLDLFEACAVGDIERVQTLLDENPERIDTYADDGFTPLGLAAFFGRLETLELLVERGADVNRCADNRTKVRPIHSAVACRDHQQARAMADRLLVSGATVNVAQQGGWTPLHQAAAHGQVEMVKLLLRHGAIGERENEDGKTAIDLAKSDGHEEVVDLLLASNASRSFGPAS